MVCTCAPMSELCRIVNSSRQYCLSRQARRFRLLSCPVQHWFDDHMQGMLTFEGDVSLVRNFVRTEDSVEQGKGGAVSNTGSGSILFKSKLTVMENEADVSLRNGH